MTTSKPLVPVLIASIVAVLLFWIATQLLAALLPSGSTEEADRAELRAQNLATLRDENKTTLETYGWVDKEKGTVRVPIAQAMEMVLPELNTRKPAAAYPIATPAAAAPATDAGAAEAPAATETAQPAAEAGAPESAEPEAPAAGVEPAAPAGEGPAEMPHAQ